MEQETLKKLRLIIPGIITVLISLYFISIITEKEFKQVDFSEYSIPFLIALVIGVFYYLTDVRHLITNYSHKKIDLNIKNHIIKLYTHDLTNEQRQFLYQKNRLKNIFYNIVDNDESLSKKSKNVYFNGLIWTTTADYFIISLIFSIVFFLSILIYTDVKQELLIGGFLLIVSGFISFGLHILAFFKHISLSNEQIEYIETHHVNDVNDRIHQILQ